MRRHGGVRIGCSLAILLIAMQSGGAQAAPKAGGDTGRATSPDQRLAPMPALPPVVMIGTPDGPLRTGFGGMVDVYPLARGLLHLSAGTRLMARSGRAAGRDGLLATPRGTGARFGRRFTPALLFGIGDVADRGLSVGADAGVMMGRMSGAPYRLGRFAIHDGRRDGLNPVARATMSYRF